MSPASRPLLGRLCWLTALLAAATGTVADPPTPRGTFSEQLDLVHVEVDVVVTDRKGRPVIDLEPADVELFRDGAKQAVTYFRKPTGPGTATPGERTAHGVASAARSLQLVVYVDNLRLWPKRRNTLLRRLGSFLSERITRGDRCSVVAFDGSIELLVVDSTSTEQILESLAEVATRPSTMARTASEARRLRQALAEGLDMSVLQPRIERFVAGLRSDAARSLQALTRTVHAVALPDTPTVIIYLSDGIPAWPGDELSDLTPGTVAPRVGIGRRAGEGEPITQGVPTPAVQYLVSLPRLRPGTWRPVRIEATTPLLEPLIRAADARGVAFYPVRPSVFLFPSIGEARAGAASRADPIGPLQRLAQSTGGDLVSYGRFEAALSRLSQRLDSAYTLGFQIVPREGDATAHVLEIQLARKNLTAHYRRAYAFGLGAGATADPNRSPGSPSRPRPTALRP